MIYFVQSPEGGSIKIGYTANVSVRVKQLEDFYGTSLVVLYTQPGDVNQEKIIHRKFGHLRIGITEQFRPGSDLMAFINRPLLAKPDPQAVKEMKKARTADKATIFSVKGNPEWREWLQRAAKHCRTDVAKFVDKATQNEAIRRGFDEPPPRR